MLALFKVARTGNNSNSYAWAILAVTTFGLIVSNGLSIGGIPVFYKEMQADLVGSGAVAAERAQLFIANAGTITFLMSGVFSMAGGWLIARYSVKLLMVLGCLALGGGLVLHAFANSAEAVYLSRFLMGVSLGFVGVAPSVVLVSNWFIERRGTALGILLTGTSLGGVTIPFIAAPLIAAYGWRNAMLAVSLLVWAILLPAILFLIKDAPRPADASSAELRGMTLGEAVRTPLFWIFGLCAALVFYPIFVTSQQFILYLQSPKIGVPLATAALAQSALFAVSVGGKFLAGFLSDRFSPTAVMLLCGVVMFLSTLVLLDLSAGNALAFLLPFGLGYGGTFVLLQRLAADYFGRREYGKILGTITLIEILGAAVGGRVTGLLADRAGGDYTTAFYGVIAATGAALACIAVLYVMRRKNDR